MPGVDEAWSEDRASEVSRSDATEDGDDPRSGPGDPDTEVAAEGAADGGILGMRAVTAYRERLTRWLSSRFRVTGSHLSPSELRRYRVQATIHVGPDRTVTRYSIIPSGNETFDRAAEEALESVLNEQLPPPPDDYPGALQSTVHMTFVCKESTCN